jgi:DNA-binding transcriptional regulator YhcF (GntR family)
MEPASFRTLRIAGRLANAFVLDLVKLGGDRRDVTDTLLRAALVHANMATVVRDAELQRRYATLDQDVPNEVRRPVSVNALASSLNMPFETVRRRLAAMTEAGVCIATPAGVIVSSAATNAPPYRRACEVQYAMLQVFYARLRTAGAVGPPPAATHRLETGDPPYRLAGRVTTEYVLRFTEPLRAHVPDVVEGLVLMELIRANTEGLPDDEGGGDGPEPDGFVDDALRRPVTIPELSARLAVPVETMRRRMSHLRTRGLVNSVGRAGCIVPSEALAREPFVQFMLDNRIHLSRLFAGLGELGVLELWDRERLATQAA